MTSHTLTLPAPATLEAAVAALALAQPGDQVLLILPEAADALAHEVRLRLLRRQADAANLRLGLVTADADVRYHARRAGIPTFATAAASHWRTPAPPPALPGPEGLRPLRLPPPRVVGLGLRAPEIVTLPGRTLLAGRTRRTRPRGWVTALGYLLLVALVAAGLAGVALLLLPQATVTLIPARTRLVSSIDVTARVGIDAADYLNRLTPARAVQAQVDGFATVLTTGVENAPLGKATTNVTLINQTNREILVPTTTVVRTTTGNNVRFRVQEEMTVPAGVGQQARVLVEAVEPGRQGNVPALTINEIEGPLNISLRVSNPAPASGGSVESVAVVTQADKERVLGQLQAELQQQAYARLAESLRQGEAVPVETVRTFTLAETYDRFNGEVSDVLGLQLQLLARGLAVDVTAAEMLARRSLREGVPEGHFLLDQSLRVGEPAYTRFGNESLSFTLTASAEALVPISTAQVRSLLAGAPLVEAGPLLQRSLALAAPPQITLAPDWLGRIPWIPTRIRVRVLEGPL